MHQAELVSAPNDDPAVWRLKILNWGTWILVPFIVGAIALATVIGDLPGYTWFGVAVICGIAMWRNGPYWLRSGLLISIFFFCEAAGVIRQSGAEVLGIIATIDRQEGAREKVEAAGYAFDSLFTVADLGIEAGA